MPTAPPVPAPALLVTAEPPSMAALLVTAEPPVSPLPPPMPQLVWKQQSDWRHHETLCEAGLAKRRVRKPKEGKVAGAQRKRLRRISLEREDRDALREVARNMARSRGDLPELEATPAGLHEAAMEGTPRSARAAGAKVPTVVPRYH